MRPITDHVAPLPSYTADGRAVWIMEERDGFAIVREVGVYPANFTVVESGTLARPQTIQEENMGTKANPGDYDCYANAEDDEPMFVLLARDKYAPALVFLWAHLRSTIEHSSDDGDQILEATECAVAMMEWRKVHRP